MIGEYICQYIHNSGKICNTLCTRPEGCRLHYKAKKRVLCTDCGKPTASACGRCKIHKRGYYVAYYYQRLREKALERNLCQNGVHSSRIGIEKYTSKT